jgi:hypothetical protein
MRALAMACFLTASLTAQSGSIGMFTGSGDIGAPPLQGSAAYTPASGEYTATGTGADIWGRADQFRYIWREMSGNFAVTTTTRFLTDGNAHRKASIMLRRTADADAPSVHLAIHGDGMAAVQFRSTKGDTVNTLDFRGGSPGVWTLKLERQGSTSIVSMASGSEPLKELGRTQSQLGSRVLVGLAVASHSVDALNTVVFSDLSIEPLTAPAPALD